MNTFSKAIYIERRNQLKLKMGSGVLLFLGNEESSINYKNNWYPFRQDSNFLYFFGLDLPGLNALIDIDEDREILFGNDLETEDTVWFGPKPGIAELAGSVGVKESMSTRELNGIIISVKSRFHFLPPYRPENNQKLAEWLQVNIKEIPSLVSEKLIKAVVGLRAVKSSEEIREITKAVNISVGMQRSLMKEAQAGMMEYELVGRVYGKAVGSGGNVSFPPIITINGQILHNQNYSHILSEGKMLLCDFGAETAMHYAGDITRTYPIGPKFTDNQKEIYQIVRNAHQSAIDALKPGIKFMDIHLLACKKLAEGLKDIGLMKGNLDEAVKKGAHALFFQCGLGHMMGLDVHDMEDLGETYVGYTEELKKSPQFGLKSLRLGRELEKGFVVTIEPGIYFIPPLIDKWQAEKLHRDYINYEKLSDYRDFGGIRIEDDFVITDNGSEILGDHLETDIGELEAVRGGIRLGT